MNSQVETNVCFKYKGIDVFGEITVKLDGKAKNYPFVDTLCFMDKNETYLSNLSFEDSYFLHSVSGECEVCDDCNGKSYTCENDQCHYNDGEIECDECDGSGDSESGKCVPCKGKGYIQCKHEDLTICHNCGEGHIKLEKHKIITDLIKKMR